MNYSWVLIFVVILVLSLYIQVQYRSIQEEAKCDKENRVPKQSRNSSILSAIEKEEKIKAAQKERKRESEVMVMELEHRLQDLRTGNKEERVILEELERVLSKQRIKMDKQRRWSETQSQYRICLEKMIRDTMQQ
jgi:uncharacterized coiled-coil protein SlyX